MFLAKPVLIVALPLAAMMVAVIQKSDGPAKSESRLSEQTDAGLLESGKPTKVREITASNGEIKIVSYNIRYRCGEDLNELVELFRKDPEIGNAVILGLQEVDRNKKRTGQANTARMIADALGFNYAWAAPPAAKPTDEEETGVAIMSPFPISDIRRMVLPHEGPNRRKRVALGATVRINGKDFRVYSMHGETRIAMNKKVEQMSTLVEDLKRFPESMPVVLVGDFNTWEGSAEGKTLKLFRDAGLYTPFGSQSTFKARVLFVPIEFRLDWVWLRGVQALTYGIDKKISLSDHYPLWANIKLLPDNEEARKTPEENNDL
ncbi:MAG TPA: endonuclease/exonuclease/phosphatase family protein [Pyrinomonadaceae bacterium]